MFITSISYHSIQMVVTNRPHSFLNRGDCENGQCGPGLVCGTNNCHSRFGWDNGDEFFDCCEQDAAIRSARCGDKASNDNFDGCCEDIDGRRCGLGE